MNHTDYELTAPMKAKASFLCSLLISITLLAAGCADFGENPPTNDPNQSTAGPMSVSVADTSALEGGGAAFLISRTGYTGASVSMNYVTANGMAFTAEDFVGDSGVVTIDSGASSTILTIATVDDTLIEDAEFFTLTLSNPSLDSATITDASAVGQIWDDDGVSYATQIKPLILRDCAIASCHGGGSMQGGVDFGAGEWAKIRSASHLGVSIVIPKDAAGSHMYEAVQTGYMPYGMTSWTVQEVKLLEDWINQDAQNN